MIKNCAEVLRHCIGRFVPREGLEIRVRLSAGGCCNSAVFARRGSDPSLDLRVGVLKKPGLGPRQAEAQRLAETIRDLYYQGISTGLPLQTLHDIPQVLISAPLAVAECLLEAVDEDGFWREKFDFLVRQEVVRVARKQLVDFIVGNRVEFIEKHKNKMNGVVKKLLDITRGKDENWPESGVLAELSTLRMFISSAADSSRLLQKLSHSPPTLGLAYTCTTPPDVPPLPSLVEAVKSITAFRHSMELQLLIDDLYFQAQTEKMGQLIGVLEFLLAKGTSKSWKTFYMALGWVEWTVHRGLWSDDLIPKLCLLLEPFLSITSCSTLGLRKKSWRLCEKLASILSKGYRNPLFRPLYKEMLCKEKDARIQAILLLPPQLLYLEPCSAKTRNFSLKANRYWKESDIADAKEALLSGRKLAVVGPVGCGKSHFAKELALALEQELDIIWLCDGSSKATLSVALRVLAWHLAVSGNDFSKLNEKLDCKRTLFLVENAPAGDISELLAMVRTDALVIVTATESVGIENEKVLKLWGNTEVAAALSEQITEKTSEIAERLLGSPLLISLAKGVASVYGQSSLSDIGPVGDISDFIAFCVKKAMGDDSDMRNLLVIFAVLYGNDCMEEVYLPVFRLLQSNCSIEPIREKLQKLNLILCEDSGTVRMKKVVQSVVLSLCAQETLQCVLDAAIKVLEALFCSESCNEATARISLSILSLTGILMKKSAPTNSEFLLCLRFLLYSLDRITPVPHFSDLLQQLSLWFDQNPTAYDCSDFPVPYFIASCYLKLDNLQKAAHYFQIEVNHCEKTPNLNAGDLAEACEVLSSVWFRLREWKKAEEAQMKAVKVREKQGLSDTLAQTYAALSAILYEQHKYGEAEHNQLLSISIQKQKRASELPTLYTNLAGIYQAQGNYTEALNYLQQAIKLDEETTQEVSEELAIAYGNLGTLYRDMGENQKAEGWLLKALEIKEEIFPEYHVQLAVTYHSLARTYFSQGKLSQAQEYEARAIDIAEKLPAFDPSAYCHFLHSLSAIERSSGKTQHALELACKSLAIRREKANEDQKEIGRLFRTIAGLQAKEGRLKDAEDAYKSAVIISEKTLPTGSNELKELYREVLEGLSQEENAEFRAEVISKLAF